MKAGRPSHRVKASWISVERDDGEVFFELDKKGNLIKQNGKVVEHHINYKYQNKSIEVALPLPLSTPYVTEQQFPEQYVLKPTTADPGYSYDEADFLFEASNFFEEGVDNCYDFSSVSYDLF